MVEECEESAENSVARLTAAVRRWLRRIGRVFSVDGGGLRRAYAAHRQCGDADSAAGHQDESCHGFSPSRACAPARSRGLHELRRRLQFRTIIAPLMRSGPSTHITE